MNKYKLENQLLTDLKDRLQEILNDNDNDLNKSLDILEDVIFEIVDNNVPIYSGDLLELVAEDRKFSFSEEKIETASIFDIIINSVTEYLSDIAYEFLNNAKVKYDFINDKAILKVV